MTIATLPERSNGLIMMLVGSEEDQRFHAPGVGRQAVEALGLIGKHPMISNTGAYSRLVSGLG